MAGSLAKRWCRRFPDENRARAASPLLTLLRDARGSRSCTSSLPVRDLAAARSFYADALGCEIGRERDGWFDAWFHGMQLTLHPRTPSRCCPSRSGERSALRRDRFAADDLGRTAHPARVAAGAVVVPAGVTDSPGHRARATEGEVRRPERQRHRVEDLRRSRRRVRRLTSASPFDEEGGIREVVLTDEGRSAAAAPVLGRHRVDERAPSLAVLAASGAFQRKSTFVTPHVLRLVHTLDRAAGATESCRITRPRRGPAVRTHSTNSLRHPPPRAKASRSAAGHAQA